MEIKITLDKYADIPFIQKLLSQIKGVKNIEILQEDKTYSWEEIENSEEFGKIMAQSEEEYQKGHFQELTDELLDEIFNKK